MQSFKGHPILAGSVKGQAAVSRQGFNTLASFQKSVIMHAKKAICSDQGNSDLYGKLLTGKILCLPQTIGSTTGGLVLESVAQSGLAPTAMLFADRVDSLAAAGIILADIWVGKRIITIDQLGHEFLESVQQDQEIEILPDGTVNLF